MKQHSCGAILYTIINKKVYIILGLEKDIWLPFKGVREDGETNVDAAIREIYEETFGVVNVKNISLNCNFSNKKKHYHIGSYYINYNYIDMLYKNMRYLMSKNTNRYSRFLEKKDIGLFMLDNIALNKFHIITKISIDYYQNYLEKIQNSLK